MLSEYITPAVLLAAIIAVWRFLHADIATLNHSRLDSRLRGNDA